LIALDTSALIAILFGEAGGDHLAAVLLRDGAPVIGAPTLFETLMVGERDLSRAGRAQIDGLLSIAAVRVVAWEAIHAEAAHVAFVRYGKGRGHPAQLNLGDCMSYALAKTIDVPLLYKGEDFALTDIRAAA
jgi:ribonuclease VapC